MNRFKKIIMNGFKISFKNDMFLLEKDAVPGDDTSFGPQEYISFELAVKTAWMLIKPQRLEWSVIVRYDRGLGIEYRTLKDVYAVNKDDALYLAQVQAADEFKKDQIKEVKVVSKNT